MTRVRGPVIAAVAAVAIVLLWPLSEALSSRDILVVRIATVIVVIIACATCAAWQQRRGRYAISISLVAALVGVALLLKHFEALDACVVRYHDTSIIIGSTFRPDAEAYLRANPGDSVEERLLDVAGAPERLWTAESIRACRLLVSWAGLAAIPFFAVSAALLLPGRRYALPAHPQAGIPPVATTSAPPVYDAFMSYRHLEPDRTIACELLETLEQRGLRVAIDARDFSPNEHFLSEMERCIKQSRFVLCVVTAQYVRSEHTSEEAIISKTLDLAERKRRLVPLVFERVELPVWMHGLVGIDFTPGAPVDPYERLTHLLAGPSATKR